MQYSKNWLMECTFDRLRLVVPRWSEGMIREALRKIRATWKYYNGRLTDPQTIELLRKEAIIRNELLFRMKAAGLSGAEIHWRQEELVGHDSLETSMKARR